jgi:tetratricopeptide (TPR) repeat protein
MITWLIPVMYFLFCIVYGFNVFLKKQENGLIKVVLITFFPVIGLALSSMLFKSQNSKPLKTASDISDGHLIASSVTMNMEKEADVIPFEDALLSEDPIIKRRMLVKSLKNGVENFEILNKAIKSDDSETAHYAAIVMMEIQKKFVTDLHDLMKDLEESPLDYEAMDRCAKTLRKYIDSGMIDKETKMRYLMQLSALLEELLKSPLKCKEYFIDLIHCELETGKYEKAQIYSELFIEEFPFDESAYLTAMMAWYALQKPEKLADTMNLLRKKPIKLSPKGLQTLHFWA